MKIGEILQQAQFNTAPYVARFLSVLKADVQEEERQAMIYAVCRDLAGQNELFFAVFECLDTRSKRAIKQYYSLEYSRLHASPTFESAEGVFSRR